MRIATWNVNSLKARQEAVEEWLERAEPDVLLMQETKLTDEEAPLMPFRMRGYELVHHGEGRWNGVAIAARDGRRSRRRHELRRRAGPRQRRRAPAWLAEEDFNPFDEARMVRAVVGRHPVRGGLRAERARRRQSPFYAGKLALVRARSPLARGDRSPDEPLVIGGDFNVAPTDADVWDPVAVHGGTHVSEPERAAFARLRELGPDGRLPDRSEHEAGRFTWWDYRAGMFHKNYGMRIDHLLR